ncbi:MAG: hypothetical protein U0U09_14320 [Cyclobacteriaceae bacterium]
MLIIALVVGGILLLAGLGRAFYKGRYTSFRNFVVTMFFLDLVFDDGDFDSDLDSDVPDIDF